MNKYAKALSAVFALAVTLVLFNQVAGGFLYSAATAIA